MSFCGVLIHNIRENLENESTITFEKLNENVQSVLSELKENVFNGEHDLGVSDMQSSYKMIFHKVFEGSIATSNISFDIEKYGEGKYKRKLVVHKDGKKCEYIFDDEQNTYVSADAIQKDDGNIDLI